LWRLKPITLWLSQILTKTNNEHSGFKKQVCTWGSTTFNTLYKKSVTCYIKMLKYRNDRNLSIKFEVCITACLELSGLEHCLFLNLITVNPLTVNHSGTVWKYLHSNCMWKKKIHFCFPSITDCTALGKDVLSLFF